MFLPINIFVFCHCTHILYNIHNNIHTHFSIFYWILRINTHSTLLLFSSVPLYENMLLFFRRQIGTRNGTGSAMRDVWMRKEYFPFHQSRHKHSQKYYCNFMDKYYARPKRNFFLKQAIYNFIVVQSFLLFLFRYIILQFMLHL